LVAPNLCQCVGVYNATFNTIHVVVYVCLFVVLTACQLAETKPVSLPAGVQLGDKYYTHWDAVQKL